LKNSRLDWSRDNGNNMMLIHASFTKGRSCAVDDTIFAGADNNAIKGEIKQLQIKDNGMHSFQLRNKGEVGSFLGISIKKL
jgi:hypothetical protein